jgi:hypothetical protein
MLDAHFHPIARHGPHGLFEIEFRPGHFQRFVGPGRTQDREFECPRSSRGASLQLSHEVRQIIIGHGRMMLDLGFLGPARQEMYQIAAPSGRVLPRADYMLGRFRRIEDVLDPASQATGRLGNFAPDWTKDGDHIVRCDRIDRLVQ